MRLKLFLLIGFVCLNSVFLYSQPYLEWVKVKDNVEAPNSIYQFKDVGTDSLGNIYFNGRDGNFIFEWDSIIVSNQSGYTLGKLNANASIEWVKSVDAAAYWLGFGSRYMVVTPEGNTYTDGLDISSSIYTFAGDTFYNNYPSGGCYGIYKHDAVGTELWCKQFLGIYLNCFTIDNNSNLIACAKHSVTGYWDSIPLTAFSPTDCILGKYDSNGELLWAKQYGGSGYDEFYSLACDMDGNIIGTGYYMSNDFVFGNDTLPPCNEKRGFVAKFTPDGEPLWFYSLGADVSIGRNVSVNSNNEIVCAGAFLTNGVWFGSFGIESPS
ncbi:MAG: hypothetical protein K9H64_22725, partial [Bacteroidales bacterium]|nr:hypothetical protein [Bacteroidales bacterium]MCF8458854.1 hypothetical protein [Bacteroidales bacterium]